MSANAIVPDLDVFEYCQLRARAAVPNRIAEFAFHRAKEALNTRNVPTLRLSAHAGSHAGYFQEISKVFTGVLASAIGVKDRPGSRAASSNRITHRIDHYTSIHGRLHRLPDEEK